MLIPDSPIMQLYEKKDKELSGEESRIVFTGSSIIQFWRTLEKDIAPFSVLNRGIAGAKINEIRSRQDQLALKHSPPAIVLYAGSNDFRREDPQDAKYILSEFRSYTEGVKREKKGIFLIFLSIAPSAPPFVEKYKERIQEANALIKKYCEKTEGVFFHDLWDSLTDDSHHPISKYYRKDGIHLTREGYRAIAPGIVNILEKVLGPSGKQDASGLPQ